LVTPDRHLVQHSIERRETDSNLGFDVPWCDRRFGTNRTQNAVGLEGMTIGIPTFREARELRLDRTHRHPFRRERGLTGQPVGAR
jgi:sterol desaturase/sphingolipid hydroxylase (fatty acid hydroxylase superfamily)